MVRIGLLILLVYAATGFLLSGAANLLTYAGIRIGGEGTFYAVCLGIFPLWLVVCIIQMKLIGGMKVSSFWSFGRDYRKVILSGSPRWLRYTLYAVYIYAVANFFFLVPAAPTIRVGIDSPPIEVWRAFSAVWMVFYGAGFCILLAAYRRGPNNLQRRCINGHDVGYGDRFCSACGEPVGEQV